MPGSFRMWRWLSATALVAVGLVMGASVAGAQQTAATHAAPWAELGHAPVSASAQFHSHPGAFLTGPQPHVAGRSFTSESTNWSGQIATGADGPSPASRRAGLSRPCSPPSTPERRLPGSGSTAAELTQLHHPDRDGAGDRRWRDGLLRLVRALSPAVGDDRSIAVSPGDQMAASIQQRRRYLEPLDHRRHGPGTTISNPVSLRRPGRLRRMDRGAPTAVGAAQPTLANFGSATFTGMTYNPSWAPSP